MANSTKMSLPNVGKFYITPTMEVIKYFNQRTSGSAFLKIPAYVMGLVANGYDNITVVVNKDFPANHVDYLHSMMREVQNNYPKHSVTLSYR